MFTAPSQRVKTAWNQQPRETVFLGWIQQKVVFHGGGHPYDSVVPRFLTWRFRNQVSQSTQNDGATHSMRLHRLSQSNCESSEQLNGKARAARPSSAPPSRVQDVTENSELEIFGE